MIAPVRLGWLAVGVLPLLAGCAKEAEPAAKRAKTAPPAVAAPAVEPKAELRLVKLDDFDGLVRKFPGKVVYVDFWADY
jgi:hypothetical protein